MNQPIFLITKKTGINIKNARNDIPWFETGLGKERANNKEEKIINPISAKTLWKVTALVLEGKVINLLDFKPTSIFIIITLYINTHRYTLNNLNLIRLVIWKPSNIIKTLIKY